MNSRPTVCAYYFPNWHVDPRNEAIHGKGWTEWRTAQYATPRFPGHEQPKVPLLGCDDEANPNDMSLQITLAVDHGIDAFIFDWYYFFDGSYRERCIRDGFLGAPNCRDLKFALMWANHNPIYAHPGSYWKPAETLWSGDIDAETFRNCTDHCIKHYLNQPNYLRVNGGLYFSFFRAKAMIEQVGGPATARALLDDFRFRVEKAGLGKLTLDGNASEFGRDNLDDANRLIRETGFDCCSCYGWGARGMDHFPSVSYSDWMEINREEDRYFTRGLDVPYNPVVPTGWDSSPRTVQSDMFDKRPYPFGTVVTDNTPELFEKALRRTAEFMKSEGTGELVHIACWNEWTEGAYLEPDTQYGYARLEAVRNVFGRRARKHESAEECACKK